MPIGGIGRYTDPSRHHVRLNNGNIVSRSTAENMHARAHGFNSNYGLKQAMKSSGFKEFKSRDGYNKGWQQAKQAGTSKADYNAAVANFYANPDNMRDNSPDGPKAKMLEAMGRRQPGADYAVGESP